MLDNLQKMDAMHLMRLHISCLFMRDEEGALQKINEPWGAVKDAPLLYLGETINGGYCFAFHESISSEQRKEICMLSEEMAKEEVFLERCQRLLGAKQQETDLAYLLPKQPELQEAAVLLTRKTLEVQEERKTFAWLTDEIDVVQPCIGIMQKEEIASLCRSVRVTKEAHEAGLETLPAYRGQGLAVIAAAAWANEVYQKNALPLYSTSLENLPSQRVVQKLEGILYGRGYSFYAK